MKHMYLRLDLHQIYSQNFWVATIMYFRVHFIFNWAPVEKQHLLSVGVCWGLGSQLLSNINFKTHRGKRSFHLSLSCFKLPFA